MKKTISLILVTIMILTLCCCGKKEIETSAETATKVTIYDVSKNDIDNNVTYTGEIKASEESYVSPKSAGTIKDLYYDIGEYVSVGATLAVLDDTDYRLAYNQALAAYNGALASYNSVTNGSLKQSTNQLEAALSSAEIAYNNAVDNYNRQKALYEAGAISKVAYESAETTMKNAELNYNTAKNNYNITINEVNKDAEVSANAAVQSAKAALDIASNSLNNTIVTAPISGYISAKNANIGQMASQGSPIYTIKSSDVVNAEISVTESIIPFIVVGTKASVNVESADAKNIEGIVTEVNTVKSDTTGMYTVRVHINNDDNKLKIGMFADVSLNVENASNAIIIPNDSIIIEEDEIYVYVADGDIAVKQVITTGISNNEYTEVKTGLKAGQKVIVSGKEYLSDKNNKIKIIEE